MIERSVASLFSRDNYVVKLSNTVRYVILVAAFVAFSGQTVHRAQAQNCSSGVSNFGYQNYCGPGSQVCTNGGTCAFAQCQCGGTTGFIYYCVAPNWLCYYPACNPC